MRSCHYPFGALFERKLAMAATALKERKGTDLKQKVALLGVLAALTSSSWAQQGPVPKGIPHLDHVFVIMMENHGYNEILNNPNATPAPPILRPTTSQLPIPV